MNCAVRSGMRATLRDDQASIRLHRPAGEIPASARWLINGYPATVLIWTAEEWSRLPEPPAGAQLCSNGVRCLLRIE